MTKFRTQSGKDIASSYAQRSWERDIADYNRYKESIERIKNNFSDTSPASRWLNYCEQQMAKIVARYPNHKFD